MIINYIGLLDKYYSYTIFNVTQSWTICGFLSFQNQIAAGTVIQHLKLKKKKKDLMHDSENCV